MNDHIEPEWQPIGSAPKDGTTVLLLAPEGIVSGWYHPGEVYETLDGVEYDGPSWVCLDDQVSFLIEGDPDGDLEHGGVTHWRPLPALPRGKDDFARFGTTHEVHRA